MKIPPGFSPSRVCSRSKEELESTPYGADPYLQRDDEGTPWLISTNGYSAMVVRVEEADEDLDGSVPVDATSAAEQHRDDDWNPPITCGPKDAVAQLSQEAPCLTLIAPRPEVLFPPVLDAIARCAEKDPEFSVSFNVRLLSRLAKGLGVEKVTLRRVPHGTNYWLVVEPTVGLGTPALGILQPLAEVNEERPRGPVVGKGSARAKTPPAVPGESAGELPCHVCGNRTNATVSLQTPGKDPTPPVCLDCMRRATDEVKATKGRAKRGGAA